MYLGKKRAHEMSLDWPEFLQRIYTVAEDKDIELGERTARIRVAQGHIDITLGPVQQRRIAGICLDFCVVTFADHNVSTEDLAIFDRRFTLRFQKGGG